MCEKCERAIARGLRIGDQVRFFGMTFSTRDGSFQGIEIGSIVAYEGKGLVRSLSEERGDVEHEMFRVRFPDGREMQFPAAWCEKPKEEGGEGPAPVVPRK